MADGDGVINTSQTFADGDQVTHTKLNNIADGSTFTDNAVEGTTLAVSNGKLKVRTITSSEMAPNSVVSAAIADGAVTTAKIPDSSITSAKIGALQVTTAKIAEDAITTAKVAEPTKSDMEDEADKVAVVDMLKHHPGIAKAWGVIENLDSTPTLRSGSYNVSSVDFNATDADYFDITLGVTMDSTNYVVNANYQHDATSSTFAIEVNPISSTKFTAGSNRVDATGAIHFTVYGKLNS